MEHSMMNTSINYTERSRGPTTGTRRDAFGLSAGDDAPQSVKRLSFVVCHSFDRFLSVEQSDPVDFLPWRNLKGEDTPDVL